MKNKELLEHIDKSILTMEKDGLLYMALVEDIPLLKDPLVGDLIRDVLSKNHLLILKAIRSKITGEPIFL